MVQKRYAQAAKAYEQALSRGAGAEAVIKLHRALSSAGDKAAAEQRLTSWIKNNPRDVMARDYAAGLYMTTGRDKAAIAQYEELIRLAPQNAAYFNNLANLYQHEKDNRALSTAERALKLAPENASIQDTLGWILVQNGQLERAVQTLRKAVDSAPRSGSIRYHLAVGLAHAGRKQEAKKELQTAIDTGGKFAELANAKAMLKDL